jgi:hypothetical protein
MPETNLNVTRRPKNKRVIWLAWMSGPVKPGFLESKAGSLDDLAVVLEEELHSKYQVVMKVKSIASDIFFIVMKNHHRS